MDMWFRGTRKVSVKHANGPKVALVIGFPLSGQNILQAMIQNRTNTSTATIYGNTMMLDSGPISHEEIDSIPLYDMQQAPFAFSDIKPFPNGSLVLTRSYCGDHGKSLFPEKYVKTSLDDWLDGCYAGTRFSNTEGRSTPVVLDRNNVKKYVHLIRNPMTNVAARFEQEHKSWKGNQAELQLLYPLNRDGLIKWCNKFDDNVVDSHGVKRRAIAKEHYLTSERLIELSWKVPCHTDFYRIVHWHNWAFEAEKKFYKTGKPVKTVRFEKLVSNAVGSDGIFDFLGFDEYSMDEFSPRSNGLENMGAYFSKQEIEYIREYVRLCSTLLTWRMLSKYFI